MYNIFVGNLSFSATKEQVWELFQPFGTINNVLIMERKKGKSRGYAFVDMPNEEEKNRAIQALEGKEFMYRVLNVTNVVPKAPKPHRPKKKFLPSKKGASDIWLTDNDAPLYEGEGQKPYRNEERPRSEKPWVEKRGPTRDREERPRSSKPWEKHGAKPGFKSKGFNDKKSYSSDERRGDRRDKRGSDDERPRGAWGKLSKDFSREASKKSSYGGYKGKFGGAPSSKMHGRREERSEDSGKSYRKDSKSGKPGGWSKDKHDSFSQATGKSGFKKSHQLSGKPNPKFFSKSKSSRG